MPGVGPVQQIEVEVVLEQGGGQHAVGLARQFLPSLRPGFACFGLELIEPRAGLMQQAVRVVVLLLFGLVAEFEYFGKDFGGEEALAEQFLVLR